MLEAPILMMAHTLDEFIDLNTAFTRLTGYTIADISTTLEWLRKGLRLPEDQIQLAAQRLVQHLEAGPSFREKEVTVLNLSANPLGRLRNPKVLVSA
jgi:hypothetical protein